MATKVRLTDRLAERAPLPEKGRTVIRDSDVPGFGLRVGANGTKTWVLAYSINGNERRITLGQFPVWTAGQARDAAIDFLAGVDKGVDPVAERHDPKPAAAPAPTIADLCARYERDHLPKKRPISQRDDKAMIARIILPALGSKPVADVKYADIDDLHRQISERAPIRANRVVSLLSKLFSFAGRLEWCSRNPCLGIEKNQEVKRERYLTPAEIARLLEVLATYDLDEDGKNADGVRDRVGQVVANIVRLLLDTGARFGEVTHMRWEQIDLEAGTWVKPASLTKQAKTHRLPLSDDTIALLRSIQPPKGYIRPLVFPNPDTGKPITTIKKSWATICQKAGLGKWVDRVGKNGRTLVNKDGTPRQDFEPNCRIHDLRHTNASILASSGLSLPIIGQMLGHSQPATTARYAHLMDDPLRAAANLAADAIRGRKPAEVIPLKRPAG